MSTKTFTKKIFDWLHQLNHDRRVRKIDLAVAVQLTKCFNEKDHSGRAWPSLKTLGDPIGFHHEGTVLKSVRRLHETGNLYVVWGKRGSGHVNQYWMVLKPSAGQVSKLSAGKVKKLASQSRKLAGGQVIYSSNHSREEKSEDFSSLGERADRLRGPEIPPPGGPPERPPGASEEESSPAAAQTSSPSEPEGPKEGATEERGADPLAPAKTSPPSKTRAPEGFAELQRIWSVRPWADGADDLAAAAKACAAAATEVGDDVSLAGARVWVAAPAFCGDNVRYLPALAKWLSGRCWEKKPPPQKRPPPPRKEPKPDLGSMMLVIGQRRARQ